MTVVTTSNQNAIHSVLLCRWLRTVSCQGTNNVIEDSPLSIRKHAMEAHVLTSGKFLSFPSLIGGER